MSASKLLAYVRLRRDRRKKVVIIGPTGSGKTTFLDTFFKDPIQRTDVKRRRKIDNKVDGTYVAMRNNKRSKKTTVSMNQLSLTFVKTEYNHFYHTRSHDDITEDCDYDALDVSLIDNPGQSRFDFISEITLRGSDAIMIFLDGTSTVSMNALPEFLEMVSTEEDRIGVQLPIFVFINKLDLANQNLYLGSEKALQDFAKYVANYQIYFFETSNFNPVTFEIPLRTMMNLVQN